MKFSEYVEHELNETLHKVGRDIHDGKVRQSHYETDKKNLKVRALKNGKRIEIGHSKAEHDLMSRKAKIAARIRELDANAKSKRLKAFMLRRVNGIQQQKKIEKT